MHLPRIYSGVDWSHAISTCLKLAPAPSYALGLVYEAELYGCVHVGVLALLEPAEIYEAHSSFIFLGIRLNDWNLTMLFPMMITIKMTDLMMNRGTTRQSPHHNALFCQ